MPVQASNVSPISRMTLALALRGRVRRPDRWMMLGPEGIGKSTFGFNAPNAMFLCAEAGVEQLGPDRFQEPESWADVLAAIDTLTAENHPYKTLIIDTLDWLEPMIFAEVCRQDGASTIEQVGGGYGKGYTAALDKWRLLLSRLDRLQATREIEVGFLAHSIVKNFANPSGPDYARYIAAVNEKAYLVIKQWVDAILFANYEEWAAEAQSGNRVISISSKKKVKGVSSGARVIHTERTAAWDAKNRYQLPPTLPLDYAEYAAHREDFWAGGSPADKDEVLAACKEIIGKLELAPDHAARQFVEANADNPGALVKALNRLRVLASEAGVE